MAAGQQIVTVTFATISFLESSISLYSLALSKPVSKKEETNQPGWVVDEIEKLTPEKQT